MSFKASVAKEQAALFFFWVVCLLFFFAPGWGGDGERYMRITTFLYEQKCSFFQLDLAARQAIFSHDMLGLSMYVLPFYAVGDVVARVWDFAYARQLMVGFSQIVLVALSAMAFYRLLRHVLASKLQRFGGASLMLFTSMLWQYTGALFSENLSVLLLILLWDVLWSYKNHGRLCSLVWAGVWLVVAMHTKVTNHILLVPFVVYALSSIWAQKQRRGVASLIIMGFYIVGVLSVMAYHAYKYGHASLVPPASEGAASLFYMLNGWFGQWFTLNKSIWVYNIPLLGSLAVFAAWKKNYPWESWLMVALLLLWTALFSVFYQWHAGVCWGPRYLLPIVPVLYLPLLWALFSFNITRLLRRTLVSLCVVAFIVQVVGMMFRPSNWANVVMDNGQITQHSYYVPYNADILGSWVLLCAFVKSQSVELKAADKQLMVEPRMPDCWLYKMHTGQTRSQNPDKAIFIEHTYSRTLAVIIFIGLTVGMLILGFFLRRLLR